MNYVVSQRALDLIELECRRNPNTETGGILVGSQDANQISITHATGPGLQWEGSSYHFVKDTEYLQSVLNTLFEYFGVNYLGVWHKHPKSMPHPSEGDISSAMEEVDDSELDLRELITPICVMKEGQVQVLPFAIKEHGYRVIEWNPRSHDEMLATGSLRRQWYNTEIGNERLIKELARLDEAGVGVELLKGNDDTYRINITLPQISKRRLVILCPAEYPVIAPEVAIYNEISDEYEPLSSTVLDNWNIFVYLVEVIQEFKCSHYNQEVSAQNGRALSGRPLPPRNWVRDGHTAAKVLCSISKSMITITKCFSDRAYGMSRQTDRLEKWFDERNQWEYSSRDDGQD